MDTKEFVTLLKDCLKLQEDCDINKKFKKEELDSIDKVKLIVLIEEYSGESISIVELFECDTLKDILDLICCDASMKVR